MVAGSRRTFARKTEDPHQRRWWAQLASTGKPMPWLLPEHRRDLACYRESRMGRLYFSGYRPVIRVRRSGRRLTVVTTGGCEVPRQHSGPEPHHISGTCPAVATSPACSSFRRHWVVVGRPPAGCSRPATAATFGVSRRSQARRTPMETRHQYSETAPASSCLIFRAATSGSLVPPTEPGTRQRSSVGHPRSF